MLRFIVHIAVMLMVGLYPLHAEISTKQVHQGLKEEKAVARAVGLKMNAEGNAFETNFRNCMLGQWETDGILETLPAILCRYSQLCYGLTAIRPTAQFISCYNTDTLIAEFTAHVVPPGPGEPKRPRDGWREDKGPNAPTKQALTTDFDHKQQTTDNPSWDKSHDYFCSRGHLTPYGDFNSNDEKDLTMIVTNIAPQWQKFNSNNWAIVESAVKEWAKKNTQLYVFTGTAEKHAHSTWSNWWPSWFRPLYTLNKRVVIPKYYWKAVCEPVSSQSIVFVAENNVGLKDAVTKEKGCLNIMMTKERGIVGCFSLADAKTRYPKLPFPPFHNINCGTSVQGIFLDNFLKDPKIGLR